MFSRFLSLVDWVFICISLSLPRSLSLSLSLDARARRVVGGMIGVSVGGGEGINVGFVGTTVGANVQ